MELPLLAYVNVGGLSLSQSLLTHDLIASSCSSDSGKNVLHIHCKYYRARIALEEIQQEQDANDAEGIIVCFDPEKDSSWQEAQRWLDAADRLNIPLRILVCHRIPTESYSHTGVVRNLPAYYQVAVRKEFELIELEPYPADVEEGEEFGVKRIKSALEAHMWSNLELLDDSISKRTKYPPIAQLNPKSKHCNTTVDQPLPPRAYGESVCREPCDLSRSPKQESTIEAKHVNSSDYDNECVTSEGKEVEHQELCGTSSDEEDKSLDGLSLDSFERAFKAIMNTRERLDGLDHDTRRKMAEKLTLQLWRAVGGSSDEIDGLSGDSSDENR